MVMFSQVAFFNFWLLLVGIEWWPLHESASARISSYSPSVNWHWACLSYTISSAVSNLGTSRLSRAIFRRLIEGSKFSCSPFSVMFSVSLFSEPSVELRSCFPLPFVSCDREVWWTFTNSEQALIWWPFTKLNDSEEMDNAGALEGGWSSEGFTGISVDPKLVWTKGETLSFLFLCVNFTRTNSTLTLSIFFSTAMKTKRQLELIITNTKESSYFSCHNSLKKSDSWICHSYSKNLNHEFHFLYAWEANPLWSLLWVCLIAVWIFVCP